MKKSGLLFISLLLALFVWAQPARHEILIPDVDGLKVLKCDFHMHTVFSDGVVWPTMRVGEAWQEGLDAISITDHLEYNPHKKYIPVDHNAAFTIAEKSAVDVGLILIKGTEITKPMPPGHLNAIFITDATRIFNDDYKVALKEAKAQGAFVFWNHPGWKAQTPNGPAWLPAHQELFDNKLFDGLEVVNHNEWYPEVLDWAIEKNLSVIGNSDMHNPSDSFLSQEKMAHRPITLVFARERNAESIREALFAKKTVAWFNNSLIGTENLLRPLFYACVSSEIIKKGEKNTTYLLKNRSDLVFELVAEGKEQQVQFLPAQSSILMNIPNETAKKSYTVKNLITGSKSFLTVALP